MIALSLHAIPTYIQQQLARIYATCPYSVKLALIRNTPATARIVAAHFTYQSGVPVGVVGVKSSTSVCSSASSCFSRLRYLDSSIARLRALVCEEISLYSSCVVLSSSSISIPEVLIIFSKESESITYSFLICFASFPVILSSMLRSVYHFVVAIF